MPVVCLSGSDFIFQSESEDDQPTRFVDTLPDDQPSLEELIDAEQRRSYVRQWVSGLSASLQRVYQAIYVDDMTHAEAAEALGVSRVRVTQLHARLIGLGTEALAGLVA